MSFSLELVNYSGQHEQEALRVRRGHDKQGGDIAFKLFLNAIKDFWSMKATHPSLCITGEDLLEAFTLTPICYQHQKRSKSSPSLLAGSAVCVLSSPASVPSIVQSPLRAFTSDILPASVLACTHSFTRTDENRCGVVMRLDIEQLILYFQKSK